MSANRVNGSAAEASRASMTRSGTRGSGRLGFNLGADGVNRDGRSRYRALDPEKPVEYTPEMLDAERNALLAEKQAQLETVFDRHDDLVREMFHMEQFTSMTLYNPVEAKKDRTEVFTAFKSKYDLLEKAAPSSGSSRQTRHQVNERRQILTNISISAPAPSRPPAKRKLKTKAQKMDEINVIPSSRADKRQGKGKEKEVEPELEAEELFPMEVVDEPMESVSAPVVEKISTVFVRRKRGRNQSSSTLEPTIPVEDETVEPALKPTEPLSVPEPIVEESISFTGPQRKVNGKRRREPSPGRDVPSLILDGRENAPEPVIIHTNGTTKESIPCPPPPPSDKSIPVNMARRIGRFKEPPAKWPSPPSDKSIPVNMARRIGRFKEPPAKRPSPKPKKIKVRPPMGDKISNIAPPPSPQVVPMPSSPSKLSVKRIKLIVRRPPPPLTNPKQRAPEPKFNSSLGAYLSSYIDIDEEDVEPSALEEEAKEEAKIRERIEQFRRDGRLIPGTDVLFGMTGDDISYVGPQRKSKDVWDEIVAAVVARGKAKPRKSIGKQITSQIASKVQAHFDAQESKKVKVKEAEERRLRNLAKSTMKLVIAEWKKAVFHIREKQRLEQEAEERRLGHAHLDAILDQSGQILETQQTDLSRADAYLSQSQSGSIGDFSEVGEEEEEKGDDGERDEEEEEDDEEADGTMTGVRSVHDVEEDEDEGSAMLLGDFPQRSSARSSTPTTTASEVPEQDAFETSTIELLNGSIVLENVSMHSDSSSDTDLEDLVGPGPESSPQRPPPSSMAEITSSQSDIDIQPEPIFRQSDSPGSHDQLPDSRRSTSRSMTPSTRNDFDSRSQSQEVEPSNLAEIEEDQMLETPADGEQIHDVPLDTPGAPMAEPEQENPQEKEQELNMEQEDQKEEEEEETDIESHIPDYLKPYAVAPVDWDPNSKVTPPLLLRGVLRPYQQSGLEWLASLHVNKLNGILADEMGLGKTIQTIALLAHLACDRGIWGPHLIVVPTSVLLNWEMEFKKFLPGFRVLSYHGSTKRRKELRQGWNDKHHFNVCITSYTLASRDAHIFKRKAWYYMILDEAHMIKNFKSQRWNILLMFRSYRRLLLTGTPLQNNLTELWALLQFLMSGANFANLKEFGEWFSNPLEKAIEMGNVLDDETMQRVSKLHTVLRPYLLRRLKRDVEKELPSKFEHLTLCPLSKRQRFLYDEFMSRAQTRDALQSGVYQKIANILMQLRKVCNHPDLFEVRPIVTSFAMPRSAIADFEIKELFIRRRLFSEEEQSVSLDVVGLRFIDRQNISLLTAVETRRLDATTSLPYFSEVAGESPPKDTRTIAGFRRYSAYMQRANIIARWAHTGYLNKLRCSRIPIYSEECLSVVNRMATPIIPFSYLNTRLNYLEHVDLVNKAVKSYTTRAQEMASLVDCFAFVTPPAVALDLPRIALSGFHDTILHRPINFDEVLHRASVKLQIAFPEPSLLQYDCGKMQKLAELLREKKAGGHRILIFTQMTRILDILEIFLNFHGYLYLRLDGATKIEDRQYITERFNADPRVFCFISSSRSGGVGINLTGADTVIFYDSDFNPQMDRQCEDRAHRIGQIRDVHIYRFVSQYTVEEAMLHKANQKRSLDDLVIQKGEFDWRSLFNDENALTKALGDYEDAEDQHAAAVAAREEFSLVGADEDDFGGGDLEGGVIGGGTASATPADAEMGLGHDEDLPDADMAGGEGGAEDEDQEEEGGTVVDYMLTFVERDWEYFREWRL